MIRFEEKDKTEAARSAIPEPVLESEETSWRATAALVLFFLCVVSAYVASFLLLLQFLRGLADDEAEDLLSTSVAIFFVTTLLLGSVFAASREHRLQQDLEANLLPNETSLIDVES
ncbi:hypothetical protein LRP88_04757 [Fusarium phalaenopsidis]